MAMSFKKILILSFLAQTSQDLHNLVCGLRMMMKDEVLLNDDKDI